MRTLPVAAVVATLVLAGCSGSSGGTVASDGSAATVGAAGAGDWPTYHRTPSRTGTATMPVPTHLAVRKRVGLDGAVYASPLVARGLTIAATEHDSVYALDGAGRQVWRARLGAPVRLRDLPCGNIDPLGITGTPVYDATSRTLYVAAELASPLRHELVALDVTNGKVRWRRSLDLPGVERRAMQQRAALAITRGRVWVPFGGLAGDCGGYKGRLVGVPLTGKGKTAAFTVPTPREGGIWTPPGPTVAPNGDLYVSVGNGENGPGDRYDYSDSVLELRGTKVVGSFSPRTWARDNAADLDLGSQGPALVGTRWVFIAGKSGTAYVLRQGRLGGIGGQVSSAGVCASFGGTAVIGSTVYVPCRDGVRAVTVTSKGRMSVRWHASPSGSPIVAGNRVWALNPSAGRLYALDPKTGRSHGSVRVGASSRFATPAVRGSDLLIPTLAGLTIVLTR